MKQPVIKLTEGSAKARKTAARLAAVQVLYQMAVNDQPAGPALQDFIDHRIGYDLDGDVFVPADQDLLRDIVGGVDNQREDIGTIVKAALKKDDNEQAEEILHCILYAGCFELLEHHDIDTPVIINDYLNVTQAFFEGGEPKLVNAVLDGIAKKLRE